MIEEEWRDIEGFPYHKVSSKCNIKSFKRSKDGYLIKTYLNTCGYVGCKLINATGELKNLTVHRLVAIAFIPNPNNYPQINHKNGNKEDPSIENLEWCNASQNAQHAYDVLGREAVYGEHNGASKLTEEQVKEIYVLAHEEVLSQLEIAEKYNVSQTIVANIKNGKWWSRLTNHNYTKRQHRKNKLTPEQAIEIHYLAWNSDLSNIEIGRKYGIGWFTVRNIKIGKLWQEVTGQQPLELKPLAKLSLEEVKEIKILLINRTMKQKDIAKKYNVTKTVISDIKLCKSWIHVIIDIPQQYEQDTLDAWL